MLAPNTRLFPFYVDPESLKDSQYFTKVVYIYYQYGSYLPNSDYMWNGSILTDLDDSNIHGRYTLMIVIYMVDIIRHTKYIGQAKLCTYFTDHTDSLMCIKPIVNRILHQMLGRLGRFFYLCPSLEIRDIIYHLLTYEIMVCRLGEIRPS